MNSTEKNIIKIMEILRKEFPDETRSDAPLAPFTSYNVGGNADLLVFPKSVDHVEQIIHLCYEKKVPFFVIGKGANVLVHDDGFRGVVVSLEKCCSQIFHEKNLLYVGAGATVKDLVEYCENNNLAGVEYMSGIPGTVGGALRMNAGAFIGEIGDRVLRIDALNNKGIREQISQEEAGFGYRRANGLTGKILLGCWIMLDVGKKEELYQARQEYLAKRAEKQPLEYPSCGSVFKRPTGDYAGRLIEESGCKGLRIGGAMVSQKHANFVVNYENATAKDIYDVICEVQEKVYNRFGVMLELEVKLVGFSKEEIEKVKSSPNEAEI
jgi:UDP-N-acetylmuramate dehydrogenase